MKKMMLYFMISAPFLMGLILSILPENNYWQKLLIFFQGVMVLAAYNIFNSVRTQGLYFERLGGWTDKLAIRLLADRFSSVMVLMVAVMYFVLLIFAAYDKHFSKQHGSWLMILQGLLMGLFFFSDLIILFILLELSIAAVSILILFNKRKQAAYDGLISFLADSLCSSLFLLGIIIMYRRFGSFDLWELSSAISLLQCSSSIILPFALVMTTVSLRAALMPLFSWLPKACGTANNPSVVSAVLSALYVKSGIYLFVRFQQLFSTAIDLSDFFFAVGFFTAAIGFLLALSQKDLELILVYHTVSQIGVIMMGINLGSHIAYLGGVYHILSHIIFKTTLVLTASMVIKDYGTRNIYAIRGVFRRMPVVSVAMIFAVLGITGAPFFNGSISKYLIAHGSQTAMAQGALMLVNMGTILSFVKFSSMLFGQSGKGRARIALLPQAVVLVMGAVCLLSGLFASEIIDFLFAHKVEIEISAYLHKAITFKIMLLLGILGYHLVIKGDKVLKKLEKFSLSFSGICTSVIVYFVSLLSYLNLKY